MTCVPESGSKPPRALTLRIPSICRRGGTAFAQRLPYFSAVAAHGLGRRRGDDRSERDRPDFSEVGASWEVQCSRDDDLVPENKRTREKTLSANTGAYAGARGRLKVEAAENAADRRASAAQAQVEPRRLSFARLHSLLRVLLHQRLSAAEPAQARKRIDQVRGVFFIEDSFHRPGPGHGRRLRSMDSLARPAPRHANSPRAAMGARRGRRPRCRPGSVHPLPAVARPRFRPPRLLQRLFRSIAWAGTISPFLIAE